VAPFTGTVYLTSSNKTHLTLTRGRTDYFGTKNYKDQKYDTL